MHEIEFMRYFLTSPFRNLNYQKMTPFPSSLVARSLPLDSLPTSRPRPALLHLALRRGLETPIHRGALPGATFFSIPEIRFLLLPMANISAKNNRFPQNQETNSAPDLPNLRSQHQGAGFANGCKITYDDQ